jgi:hypothetical protein
MSYMHGGGFSFGSSYELPSHEDDVGQEDVKKSILKFAANSAFKKSL